MNRIEIYVGAPLRLLLGEEESATARVNQVAERYLEILEHDLPAFLEGEWRLLQLAFPKPPLELHSAGRLLFLHKGARARYGHAEVLELARRLQRMTRGQLVATFEALPNVALPPWPPAD